VTAVTDPHVAAAAQFPSRQLVWLNALPSRASNCRPPTPTGGHRQLISFSPAHMSPVAAIADFRLLAPPAHGYCARRYSRPPPTWLKYSQYSTLSHWTLSRCDNVQGDRAKPIYSDDRPNFMSSSLLVE